MREVDQMRLPSGWTLTPVGDLLKFKNGLNKGKAFFGYGTPIVNYMDVFRHAGLRRSDVHGLVDVTNTEKQAFSARKGDILFTRTSETPEEVGISTVLLEDIEDAVFSGFVLRGRPVGDRLTSEFAQYCFASRFVRGQIVSSATYTTRALTNGRILSNVKLPLPDDPDEQQAIAAALSDADGVAAGLERVIAKKRLIKQGAMQDLLTARRRLPGFSGECEAATLSELADIRSGGTPSTSDATLWDGDIAWVTPTDITALDGRKFLSGTTRTISRAGLRQSSAELLPEGTIVMTSRATIGECAIATIPLTTNQGFKNFIPKDRADRDFLYYLLMSQKKGFIELCSGSTFLEIGKTQLTGYTVQVPETREEQQAIAAVLSDMDAEIQALESRLDKARAVKEGMMQNLLTGRVRLV
ncbi:restriction endonuclease subunit S [Paracoccus sp. p4-l81]|uniref:restriction endonuclease subunit S n=1 Tax=Paracoccus sp. p4-l81 TaxID=3342806 RepID=UPI0035B76ECB